VKESTEAAEKSEPEQHSSTTGDDEQKVKDDETDGKIYTLIINE